MTIASYDTWKNSENYVLPNVSYVVTSNCVYYEAPEVIPNNEIWYTTNDGNIVTPYNIEVFGDNIVSNTYVDGKGVIEFDGDVTTIGDCAFDLCTSLTSVTIPDSTTEIGYMAFGNCNSLASVTIGNGVTSIGDSAFSACYSLTSVTIPDSVTTIGYGTFWDCTNLTSVTIGDSVTTIGERAFYDCSSLISVTIPDSVTTIGERAFNGCTGELIINNKVLVEIDYAFDKRPTNNGWLSDAKFTKLTIGDGIEKIGNFAFSGCSSLTSVTIGDSVTSIGDSAFQNCTSLTNVTIPSSVTTIVDYAFFNCSSLTSVYCKATTPPSLEGTRVFENYASGCKIYVPTNSVSSYKSAINWSDYADAIVGYDF